MSFRSLGLSESLLRAVELCHYNAPTPIQEAAIPRILEGGDLWSSAQTGSGKSAAFILPMLQMLSEKPRERGRLVRALILVPTRELAVQIGEGIHQFSRFLPVSLKTLIVYGGVSINPQMMALGGGTDLLVATPGRLLDLLDHNALSLAEVSILVLDEADRLLELGFSEELNRILSLIPKSRQSLLFSATFPAHVEEFASRLLQNPTRIEISSEPLSKPDILQRAIEVDAHRRTQLLRHLIREYQGSRLLVFVSSQYATEHVADKLLKLGVAASALHGELSQGTRIQRLSDFKEGKIQVLIATDLAARGIDIELLPVVVNYDLPRSPVDYIHRIGRTGRAGESGIAINFISAESDAHFHLIEKRNKIQLPREQIAGFEPQIKAIRSLSAGGIKGKRMSKKDKLRAKGLLPPI